MVTGKIDAREGKRKMKQTCKKTDVKTKPYPERSKEKSSEAEITKSAAVSGTWATWNVIKRFSAWNMIKFNIRYITLIPKHTI